MRLLGIILFAGLCGAFGTQASVTTNATQDLVFKDLTAALTYAIPAGETATFRRIVTSGEKTVTITGGAGSRLALFGGGSVAPIQNDATDYSVVALDFRVPVDLTADDGVQLAYVGGVTFREPVTLANVTETLALRRKKGTGLKFTSANCVADLSAAGSVEIGYPGQDFTGLNLAVASSASLALPSTVIAKGSQLSADNSATIVIDGDLTAPDPTYLQNGKTVYSVLKLSKNAAITCRRLVESRTDGLRAFIDSGTFTATEGIEIHSLSDTPFKVGTATVRTPDFNTRGSQYVAVTNVLTLDTQDGVTRVGKLKVKAGKKVSVRGGGAVSFLEPVTLPVLELKTADDTLLFDGVTTDRFALVVQSLALPAGTARIKVVSRMVSGTVTLATGGITEAQFDALEKDIPSASTLTWQDGALVFSVENDLTLPVRAVWTADGWTCFNAAGGELAAGTEPNEATTNLAFAADAPLGALDAVRIGEGAVLDLQGHAVTRTFGRSVEHAFTVTDTSAGQPGTFHLVVQDGIEFFNDRMTLAGNLRLVKEGEGTYVAVCRGDSFTGGETIVAGRIVHLTEVVRYEEFGAAGDGVTDDKAAILAAHQKANEYGLPVRAADDATYYIGGERTVIPIRTDVDFGTARFIIDDSQGVADLENDVFCVTRDAAAVDVPGIGPLVRGQANLGVTFPGRRLVQVVDSNHVQFIRKGANANDGSSQHEVVLVEANGDIDPSTPLVWDYETVTSATAYPADDRPLTLRGGVFTTVANRDVGKSGVYYARGIGVERSNVRIEGLRHAIEGEGDDGNPYNGFIAVLNAANVVLADCVFSGHRVYELGGTSRGSYDISVKTSAGVTLVGCTQANDIMDSSRWGVFVSNYSKCLTYDRCTLSRFDAHCGVCNATIRRTTLGYQGINAIGFGTLLVEDSTVKGDNFISLRTDYGSFWNGEFVIRNCRYVPKGGRSAVPCLVNEANDGTHDFGYPCMMPRRVTVDGLYVDDSNHPSSYSGGSVFGDPNAKNTGPDYVEKYPYTVTERLSMKDVTTASGLPLKTDLNGWMFRNLQVSDATMDIDYTLGKPSAGWNWTNHTVCVDVTRFDASWVADGRLVLTVRDAAGRTVCTRERPVTAAGTVDFDIDVPAAGAAYQYEVRAFSGDREIVLAPPVETRDLFAGTIGAGERWFGAAVEASVPVTENGQWQETPVVADGRDAYAVSGRAAFEIGTASTAGRTVRVDMEYPVEELADAGKVTPVGGRLSVIAAAADEGGRWMCAEPTADSVTWRPLVGCEPVSDGEYVVRMEVDRGFDPPRARYSVRRTDEEAFTVLRAEDGSPWQTSPLSADWMPARVAFEGDGLVTGLEGWKGEQAVASVGGVGYDDFTEAVTAASDRGQPVSLTVDVAFVPTEASGSVTIEANGKRMKWTDEGGFSVLRDPATGSLRFAEIPAGGNPNGLTSYESYALGLDPTDPSSRPLADFVREADGSYTLSLRPTPPDGTGAQVSCSLVESATPDFAEAEVGPETAGRTFRIEPTGAAARFFRLKITVR